MWVDDIITAVPENKVDEVLLKFNSFNKHIKFTVEIEKENKIPFLDVLLQKNENGDLITDWYHKKTWSGRYLHFNSALPMSYKRNTVTLLADKIFKLSDIQFHKKNLDLLTAILKNNGYPEGMIKSSIRDVKMKMYRAISNEPVANSETRKKIYVSIPYVKHLFERVKHLLAKYDIIAVGRSHNSLKNVFSNLKDKTPLELQSNVIYKAECQCGINYIGQTKQNLRNRVNQHKNDAKRKESENQSALSQHIRETQHQINLEDFKVLDSENNLNKRRVLEMIRIKQTPNTINRQTETDYLKNTYDIILKSQ